MAFLNVMNYLWLCELWLKLETMEGLILFLFLRIWPLLAQQEKMPSFIKRKQENKSVLILFPVYIQGGISTRDEMCLDFMFYYPRVPHVRRCLSIAFEPTYKTIHKYLWVSLKGLERYGPKLILLELFLKSLDGKRKNNIRWYKFFSRG